jgi:lipopolysaccharide heptosyltransferase II
MDRPSALAVCTTAIGDTLLSTPALLALSRRYDLDVLVHRHRAGLLEAEPHIRRLYTYRNNALRRFTLGLTLGRRRYDRLLVLHANRDILRLLPRLSYAQAGTYRGWERPDLNLVNLSFPQSMHVADKRLALAAWAGADPTPTPMRIHLRPAELEAAEAWLSGHGLPAGRLRVGLCPGAANLFKRWPAARFGQVARALVDQGAAVFLMGSGREARIMDEAQRAAGRPLARLAGAGLRTLAAVLARSQLVITNDTGPLHLSQAVQTPVLALFGPTHPEAFGPRGPADRLLKVAPTCNPCLTKACQDPHCLDNLSVDMVLEQAGQMLTPQNPAVVQAGDRAPGGATA